LKDWGTRTRENRLNLKHGLWCFGKEIVAQENYWFREASFLPVCLFVWCACPHLIS